MKGFFWHGGRFGWGFVILVVILAVWLVSFDLAWRLIEISFGRLLGAGGAVLLSAIGLFFFVRHRLMH